MSIPSLRNSNWFRVALAAAFVAAFALTPSVLAVVTEPDNVIYGNIMLGGQLVTAADTDVVIEARRSINGAAVASYRMGSDVAFGNFYVLKLAMESVTPMADSNAWEVAQTVYISVVDGSGLRATSPFTIVERGAAQRVDFGVGVVDSDGDGLPDSWELQRYGGLGQSPLSVAPNGLTALDNFIAGTDPKQDSFRLEITTTNSQKRVSFLARRAEGPGYEGMTRRYTLELNSANLADISWANLPGFVDVAGNNQTVNYVTAGGGVPTFFRGRITLDGFNAPLVGDRDHDSLPDAWEVANFGNTNLNASSTAPNGLSALQNYVAGSDPNSTTNLFKLIAMNVAGQRLVSFVAQRAEGAGYEGKTRYYTMESSSDVASGPWSQVPGVVNILGDGQTVIYPAPSTALPVFYRAQVWLQP